LVILAHPSFLLGVWQGGWTYFGAFLWAFAPETPVFSIPGHLAVSQEAGVFFSLFKAMA